MNFRGSKQSLDAQRKSVECPIFFPNSLLTLAVNPITVNTLGMYNLQVGKCIA